jgi:hypothetical protein
MTGDLSSALRFNSAERAIAYRNTRPEHGNLRAAYLLVPDPFMGCATERTSSRRWVWQG